MGHLQLAKEEVFKALAKRLDSNPIAAPLNETLMKILHTLYSLDEAKIGGSFPLLPAPIDKIKAATGFSEPELLNHLNNMANKGLIIDVERRGQTYYMLSPLVVGFFEYTFMRVNDNLPMHQLAHLFEEYHSQPGVAEEFFGANTKLFQTWGYESAMPHEVESEILPYEKASEIIRQSGGGALTMCYCRHQTLHLGKNCDAPIEDVCTSLGNAANWLIKRGFARPATVDEMLRVLDHTEKLGLVHMGDNVQNSPAYICHCCGCCCGVLRSLNEHGVSSVHPSNFIPKVKLAICTGCGLCEKACHINAIAIIEGVPGAPKNKTAVIKEELCIGCGVCLNICKSNALEFNRRSSIRIPPLNIKEQMQRIAKEKGKLK